MVGNGEEISSVKVATLHADSCPEVINSRNVPIHLRLHDHDRPDITFNWPVLLISDVDKWRVLVYAGVVGLGWDSYKCFGEVCPMRLIDRG